MELVGRVQPLAEGGHAVFFPLPAEPARDEPIVLLQSAEEAGSILDVLNLKRALEMRMALAELPLVRPLTVRGVRGLSKETRRMGASQSACGAACGLGATCVAFPPPLPLPQLSSSADYVLLSMYSCVWFIPAGI